MIIPDHEEAENILSTVSYYRLSGYWHICRQNAPDGGKAERFVAGTTLQGIVALYEFDRQLKLFVSHALEKIEIMMRARITETLGARDPFAHANSRHLDPLFSRVTTNVPVSRHDQWLNKLDKQQERSSERFVQHFSAQYNGDLPVWAAMEVLDFGAMSHLFSGLTFQDRNAIALALGITSGAGAVGNEAALTNWLRVMNYVRNVCAHHSRLWNSNMNVQLKSTQFSNIHHLKHLDPRDNYAFSRVFGVLCVIGFLVSDIDGNNKWVTAVRRHVEGLNALGWQPERTMGFPRGWTALPLWR